jgi:membrane protein YdbS with pleckstrin-like domain
MREMSDVESEDARGEHSHPHLHHTPTSQLHHDEKIKRQERHLQILTLVLVLVLAMLAYSAAFDLDNWSEWVVLGGICSVAVGTIIAVNTH